MKKLAKTQMTKNGVQLREMQDICTLACEKFAAGDKVGFFWSYSVGMFYLYLPSSSFFFCFPFDYIQDKWTYEEKWQGREKPANIQEAFSQIVAFSTQKTIL